MQSFTFITFVYYNNSVKQAFPHLADEDIEV